MKKNVKCHGFTLIELLVVIFIIGVLVALILANILSARQRAEDTQRKSDLQQLKKALMIFYSENQTYPTEANLEEDLVPEYIKELPEIADYDPDIVNDSFNAHVILDNLSDKDVVPSQNHCNVSGPEGAYYVCED